MTPTEYLIEGCLFWLEQELSAYEIIQKIENDGNYAYTDLTADQIYDICQYFYMHHLSPDSVAADCYPKVGYPESYAYHCELLGEKPPIVRMNAGMPCCANCQYLIENEGYYDCGNIANLSKCFWTEKTFWSDGYFIASIGEVSAVTLKEYIENQGKSG